MYPVYSVTDKDFFFKLPSKPLGRIVHGLCFSRVNLSSVRCILRNIPGKLVTRDFAVFFE